MSLLSFEDIQKERNIDLTDPNGQEVATILIAAATAEVASRLGYPVEQGNRTTYFSAGDRLMYLPTRTPVANVVLATRTHEDYADLPVSYYEWDAETAEVFSLVSLPASQRAVKASYQSGWTPETLPRDLREVIIDMVTLKLQAINNFSSSQAGGESGGGEEGSGTEGLKKLSIDGYTEEYSTARTDAYWRAKAAQLARTIGDDLPEGLTNVLARWRLVGVY